MSGLRRRLDALLRRGQWEHELDEELRFHLDARTDRLVEQGMERAAARRRARLELGLTGLHRDAARQAWGLGRIDAALHTLRLAWRGLRRSRAYTLTAGGVLCTPLALGVLLYALFSAYALQAPPVERPERWFTLDGRASDAQTLPLFSADEAAALLADPPLQVEGLYSTRPLSAVLRTGREQRGLGEAVSDNLFALFGLPAERGRLWWGGNDARDRDTLLLSRRGAEKLFGPEVDPVGARVDVAGKAFTVVGVVGAGYSGLMPVGALFWIRAQDVPEQAGFDAGDALRTEVGGFRRAETSLAAVSALLSARAASLSEAREESLRLAGIEAVQRRGVLREQDRREALLAGAPVALLVLLILAVAAANLANLVLARFSARRHELALCAAIGAGRRQLFTGLLVECLLLGLLAAACAIVLVAVSMQPIHDAVFGFLAEFGLDLHTLRIGWDAVGVGLLMGVLAALGFGALPAWWLTSPYAAGGRADPDAAALKKSEPAGLRGGLMSLQLAASVFLVVLAGLIAANARDAQDTPLGFDPADLVALGGIEDGGALARSLALRADVAGLSATSHQPLLAPLPRVSAFDGERSSGLSLRHVDAGWRAVLDLPLRAGRWFALGEGGQASGAVLSERAARALWPDASPLGRRLLLQGSTPDGEAFERTVEVIGVVADSANGLLLGDPLAPMVYLPAAAGSASAPVLLLKLRAATPARLAELERDCLRAAPSAQCAPMRLEDALTLRRLPFVLASRIAGALAWLALGISCIGLYGLVRYALVRQRKELGVRLALGATPARLIAHVMRGAARPLLIGLCIGLLLALGLGRLLAGLSEQLRVFSLDAFLLQPLLLVGVALLAAWLPARAASRIAPSESLRAE